MDALMSGKSDQNYYLLLLWVFHSILVLLLAYVNPNHYTTIDSQYYLESARNILDGHGYSILEKSEFQWNGTFPAGYSLTIVIVSFFTKTDVLWASKIVNISASGIWFFLLNLWFGRNKSILIGCILLSGSFLKLWAHTWSEPLFLVILFCWVYHFYHLNNSAELSVSGFTSIFLLGLFLIFVRYAGIFIIPLTFGYGIYNFREGKNKKNQVQMALSIFWSAGFVFYLLLNYRNSRELFGGVRFDGNIRIIENIISFGKGLINELSFFGNFMFHSIEMFPLTAIAVQAILIDLIFKESGFSITRWTKHNFIVAFFYFICLFILRIFSPFDYPGYRLLSPFTFLILCGILSNIQIENLTSRMRNLLILLFIVSWAEIIPDNQINDKLQKSLQIVKNYIQSDCLSSFIVSSSLNTNKFR